MSLSIGKLAAQAGVNVDTGRYDERRGPLSAAARPPSGHRESDHTDVHRPSVAGLANDESALVDAQ